MLAKSSQWEALFKRAQEHTWYISLKKKIFHLLKLPLYLEHNWQWDTNAALLGCLCQELNYTSPSLPKSPWHPSFTLLCASYIKLNLNQKVWRGFTQSSKPFKPVTSVIFSWLKNILWQELMFCSLSLSFFFFFFCRNNKLQLWITLNSLLQQGLQR